MKGRSLIGAPWVFAVLWAKGPRQASPGQRPGNGMEKGVQALKGRDNVKRAVLCRPFRAVRIAVPVPRALSWAGLLSTFGAWNHFLAFRASDVRFIANRGIKSWLWLGGFLALCAALHAQNVEFSQISDPVSIVSQTTYPLPGETVSTVTAPTRGS